MLFARRLTAARTVILVTLPLSLGLGVGMCCARPEPPPPGVQPLRIDPLPNPTTEPPTVVPLPNPTTEPPTVVPLPNPTPPPPVVSLPVVDPNKYAGCVVLCPQGGSRVDRTMSYERCQARAVASQGACAYQPVWRNR